MRVLIAGGAGCLGSFTSEQLVAAGHDVVVVDSLISGDRSNLAQVIDKIAFIEADICDAGAYESAVGRIDAVIHLAFPTPLCTRDPAHQFHDTAGRGTANLLDLARRDGAYFIYGSSISVYGVQQYTPIDELHPTEPMLIYGANKLHGEVLTNVFGRTYGVDYAVLRYSDLYGPRDRRRNAVNAFIEAALSGQSLKIFGGGQQKRTLTYFADAGEATLMALETRPSNAVFNIAAPEAISVLDLAEMVRSRYRPEIETEAVSSANDPRDYVFDARRFADQVGRPAWTSLEQGLDARFEYSKRQQADRPSADDH